MAAKTSPKKTTKKVPSPKKSTKSKTVQRTSSASKLVVTSRANKSRTKRTVASKKKPVVSLSRLLSHAVILAAIVGGVLAVLTYNGADASTAIKCYKDGKLVNPNTKVDTKYGINGFFMYTSSNECVSRNQVEQSHRIGATNIFTVGSTLKSTSKYSLERDATYKQFRVNGQTGYDYAVKRAGNVKVNRIFTYSNKETFGSNAFNCSTKNGAVNIGYDGKSRNSIKGVFSWWLFPVDGSYSGCHSPTNTYDLVISYSKSPNDANSALVNSARMYNMKVYLGTPKPQADPKVRYVADNSYLHTLGSFTTRVFASWNQRYGNNPGFAGAYQTLETAAFSNKNIWNNNLKVYKLQNQILTWHLPKSKERMVISPYADLNAQTTARVTSSFREIVNTASGARVILMPQDGVGTGRVGLHRVSALYAAAKQAGAPEFWANIEAFKPGGKVGTRPLTDKYTVDRQIAAARRYTPVVMSYDWNQFKAAGIYNQLIK